MEKNIVIIKSLLRYRIRSLFENSFFTASSLVLIFSCAAFSQCPNAITEKHIVIMKEKGTICADIPKDSIELCADNFPYSSFIKPLFQKDVYFVWYDSLIAFVMVRPKERTELYKGSVRTVLLESPCYCIDKDGVKDVDYLGPYVKDPLIPLHYKKKR